MSRLPEITAYLDAIRTDPRRLSDDELRAALQGVDSLRDNLQSLSDQRSVGRLTGDANRVANALALAARGAGGDDVRRILAAHPEIGFGGYRIPYWQPTIESFEETRTDMLHPSGLKQYHVARAFLEPLPKWDKFDRGITTSAWKHHAEWWARKYPSGDDGVSYISNGWLMVAAISLGFELRPLRGSHAAHLNLQRKYAERCARTLLLLRTRPIGTPPQW